MNKSSWLIYVYIVVGVIIISSLLYSFNFSVKDIKNVGKETPTQVSTSTALDDAAIDNKTSVAGEKETLVLELGKSKMIQGVSYVFSRVASDTRSAEKDKCTEPGKAEVDLMIGGAGTTETVKLSTAAPSTYNNQTIEVMGLNPTPVSGKKIELTIEITNNN